MKVNSQCIKFSRQERYKWHEVTLKNAAEILYIIDQGPVKQVLFSTSVNTEHTSTNLDPAYTVNRVDREGIIHIVRTQNFQNFDLLPL